MPSTGTGKTKRNEAPYTSRSCQQCFRRKIKCDGYQPCSACSIRGLDGICQKYRVQRKAKKSALNQSANKLDSKSNYPLNVSTSSFLSEPTLVEVTYCTRISHLLVTLKRASQTDHGSLFIDIDGFIRQANALCKENNKQASTRSIPLSKAYLTSSALIFASALEGFEPIEEFTKLLEANRMLKRHLIGKRVDLAVLQSCRMMAMALTWCARTDEAVLVVRYGIQCSVTMGLHHPAVLASHPPHHRALLLDVLLHLTSQACLFHALFGINIPIDPSQIDAQALIACCADCKLKPSPVLLSRFEMHSKAWSSIERYFRADDGKLMDAPTAEHVYRIKGMQTKDDMATLASLDIEICKMLKQGADQGQDERELGDPISDGGIARLLLMFARLLRALVQYPFAFEDNNARSIVRECSISVFHFAWSLVNEEMKMDGTTELCTLITLRLLSLLQQIREERRHFINESEQFTAAISLGRQAATSLSGHLRMESSAFQKCQEAFFSA